MLDSSPEETALVRRVGAWLANTRSIYQPILISQQITYHSSLWAGKIITREVMIDSRDSHPFLINLARPLKTNFIFKTKLGIIKMECKMIKWLWASLIDKEVKSMEGIWASTHGCHPCHLILRVASVTFLVEIHYPWTLLQTISLMLVIKKESSIQRVCPIAFQMVELLQPMVNGMFRASQSEAGREFEEDRSQAGR